MVSRVLCRRLGSIKEILTEAPVTFGAHDDRYRSISPPIFAELKEDLISQALGPSEAVSPLNPLSPQTKSITLFHMETIRIIYII